MTSIHDAMTWVGLNDQTPPAPEPRSMTRTSFLTALGLPALVRQIVAIPLATWAAAVAAWQINTRMDDD